MRRALLALALAASGCGVVVEPTGAVPAADPPVSPLEAIETTPPTYADGAIAATLAALHAETGIAIPVVRVRWTSEPIPFDNGLAGGVTWDCQSVWVFLPGVALGEGVQAHDTALAHELAHCMRLTGLGDGDANHTDPVWWTQGQGLVFQTVQAQRAAGY